MYTYHDLMKKHHDPRKHRVAEPVQVYLSGEALARLERLAGHLETTKSDVLRRGLEALEERTFDPAAHPVLGLIGFAEAQPGAKPADVARDHDRILADSEVDSWALPGRKRRGR
jgi:hypothetical protein